MGFLTVLVNVISKEKVESSLVQLPLGTNLMSSYQVIGSLLYLLLQRTPSLTSSNGSPPHSSCFWVSLNAELASTRYTCSTAEARLLKFTTVCVVVS